MTTTLTKAQQKLLLEADGKLFVRGHPATVSCLVPVGYLKPHGPWWNGEYRITRAGRLALKSMEGKDAE